MGARFVLSWTLAYTAALYAWGMPAPLVAQVGGSAAPSAARWLFLSDVHFNPFDDPTIVDALVQAPALQWKAVFASAARAPSPYFKDTNFALLESALGAMRVNVPDPPVVVIAGDFLAHYFPDQFAQLEPHAPPGTYEQFVDKTIAFLAAEFDAAYPNAQFVITLGNNDGYCGDYKSTPQSPFLAHMASVWGPLVDRNDRAPNFTQDFSNAGYYTATLPPSGTAQVVVLNSVLWSADYQNACGNGRSDPGAAQLDWLQTTLASATERRLLLTHIPPGIDEYASIGAKKPVPLLKDAYAQRLLGILASSNVNAGGLILGHIHHATFEIVGPGNGSGIPAPVVPSISSNQGNNPAFIAADVDPSTLIVRDMTTYALPLATPESGWFQEYDFDASYGLGAVDAPNLNDLQATLGADQRVRDQFVKNYNSQSPVATPAPSAWPWYWCGHLNLTAAGYAACVAKGLPIPGNASDAGAHPARR